LMAVFHVGDPTAASHPEPVRAVRLVEMQRYNQLIAAHRSHHSLST
jgi:hypothetical protein